MFGVSCPATMCCVCVYVCDRKPISVSVITLPTTAIFVHSSLSQIIQNHGVSHHCSAKYTQLSTVLFFHSQSTLMQFMPASVKASFLHLVQNTKKYKWLSVLFFIDFKVLLLSF